MPIVNPKEDLKKYVNSIIDSIIKRNEGKVKQYEFLGPSDNIEQLVNEFSEAIKDGKSALEAFVEILYVENKVTIEQLRTIPDLINAGNSFIPSTSNFDHGNDYGLNLQLLLSRKILFDDIKSINDINKPLKYKNIKKDILDGSTTLENKRFEFHNKSELESAGQYKKLRKSIEDQINRILKEGGVEKAKKLSQSLASIDQDFKKYNDLKVNHKYNTHMMSCYEFLLNETKDKLLRIFNEKRSIFSNDGLTTSYKAIHKTIKEIQVDIGQSQRRREALPIKPSDRNLGESIIELLMSKNKDSIESVFECIKKFNLSQRVDFINVYHRVFQPGLAYKARFNDESSETVNHLIDKIALNVKANIDKEVSLQFQKWFEVMSYTLASEDSRFDNGFNCPVVDFQDAPVEKKAMAERLTQAASFNQLMFQADKSGGAHSAGPLGGVYLRHYIQSGKLHSQQSLIKQANENGSIKLLDNMREAWGGFYVNSLAPNNNASISLVTKPYGKAGVANDVYVESHYFKNFVSAHQAAHENLKEVPKRAPAKYCGQLIHDPLLGNPHFQEGIKEYVSKNRVSMTSLARATFPRWLAGDKQDHTENVGFAEVNGKIEFVSLDFGGAGRRPYSDSVANLKTEEMDSDFSSDLFPFKGKGNKLGACYARALPLEFYLHPDYIQEGKKILAEARENSASMLQDNAEHMKAKFGDKAFNQFSAAFGRSGTVNATNFESFIDEKNNSRIRSLENFVLELELWNLIKAENVTDIKSFFKSNASFNFPYVTDIEGTKGEFTSKNLRVLFQEDGSKVTPEFIAQVVKMAIDQKRGKQEVTGHAVKLACSLYQKEKDVKKGRYNPFRNDSALFKDLTKWAHKHEEHTELVYKDKLELITMIHQHREATTENSASRKPAQLLLKTLCPIDGDNDGSLAFGALMAISDNSLNALMKALGWDGVKDHIHVESKAAMNWKMQLSGSNPDESSSYDVSAAAGENSYRTPSSSTSANESQRDHLSTPLLQYRVNDQRSHDYQEQKYQQEPSAPLSSLQHQDGGNRQTRLNAGKRLFQTSHDTQGRGASLPIVNQNYSASVSFSTSRLSPDFLTYDSSTPTNEALPSTVASAGASFLNINTNETEEKSNPPLSTSSPENLAKVLAVSTPNAAMIEALSSMKLMLTQMNQMMYMFNGLMEKMSVPAA